ncbi:winged helix-turn-helix domain-containing protein [Frankia sp. R82]|uniref:winged helix-turn-helix domain-containing protein n=1 Tax=Frankia sp. R82 TaxID=2950553 RepID=UPI002043DD2E|nr:winged helix-turn-helix domain-containing protein [Frankia sp. R82]MCM3886552.1 winged helix-turn-helix domain-containing protein [Frankia sp. R82]
MRTTLLLVGDEAGTRRELLTTLVDEGYGVDTARSADQALAVLAARSVDLVLTCLPLSTEPGALPLPDDLAALDDPWFDRLGWAGQQDRPPAREQLSPPERAELAAERLDTLVYGPDGPPPVDLPSSVLGLAVPVATPAVPRERVTVALPTGPDPTAATGTGLATSATAGVGVALAADGTAVQATAELAISGLEFCRRVRAAGDVPLVVVAERGDPSGLVAGLEAGADDYITAPPLSAEALARLRALLRRTRPDQATARALRVGELQIRPAEGVVCRHGEDQCLTRTEFRLLCELAVAGGRAVSRRQLMERIWGYDYYGGARMLDVHVRRLRRKVEVDPSAPTHILTVRGIGYRVCTPSGGD